MNSMSMLFSSHSPHTQKAMAFLQKPNFLHGFSASFHLLLLILLFIIWISKRFKTGGLERTHETCKGSTFFGYKATLFTCLGLSLFHLFLCIFNYFYWCRFGWSEEYHATQLDLVVRTLVWLAISAYLHFDFSQSYGKRLPTMLRIWWGSYFLISCSFIVVNLVYYRKPGILPTHLWVMDVGSVLFSFLLCYTGFVGKRNEEMTHLIEEPLLNGTNDVRSREVTPYAYASLLSILSFSWMGPLMKLGNKKTLDLDDIPELADVDSANSVFHVFHNELEESCRSSSDSSTTDSNCRTNSNGVGTLKLVNALLFSVRKEVLLTGFLAFLNTSSSYVGPYLIDTFVQYLNGRAKSLSSTGRNAIQEGTFTVKQIEAEPHILRNYQCHDRRC
ncbi:ABC transporter C family member 3-like protein isoform X1 [Cinnamomum micranthum f. kanehirae]|uniref:ABC transporter C family member 3-like protein isoform X1 n=1 Tax=Cinnamomum micranthum f. kanehirae TaxID=337451 RepID=A0A443P641_9MAGN|nr:ABC transporter C family member 3-like protein isoform X1 [Cinnamomum micranthum f. kanehirae]